MDLGELIPIVAIACTAWVMVTAMHYRHGGRRSRGGRADPTASAEDHNARLAQENADLRRVIGRLEERLAVLERIATDPAERTAREIESLR